ncbi:MAG: hypothetical protein E7299_02990 [Lachnospiraceae bacterium]|nr:hypothetical protein [Lachnospiraceae bacterium]
MIDAKNFKHLNYIKKEPLSGSYDGMRYMLMKEKDESGDYIQGYVWPEPLGFAKTADDKKTGCRFTLDEDGVGDAVAWLNKEYFEHYMKQ